MIEFRFNFIQGVSCGFEFAEDYDDGLEFLIIDLFIFRFMIGWIK